jgi:flagellar M-ring protein FliF
VNPHQFFARLQAAVSALSARQLVTLGLAFAAVVSLVIGSAYWLNTPTYSVLLSDVDAESASGVVARLKNDKVPYLIDDGGRTIRVPASRVDELRLDLASQGLPASGRIGFEIFDRTAFGVTDFQEHVNYRRALEGELARTISTIAEVAGARVHIAMPQPSLFAGRDQPTTASVVLKLRGNKQLQPSTVTAIAGLVAASVESLKPESVVIIDNFGRPLARPSTDTDEAQTGAPLERQHRIERDLSTRVVALLEPIVGPGRVRVNVSAKLKSGTSEETEERWDPTPIVRSRQSVNQSAPAPASAPSVAAPIPAGARGNLPPAQGRTPETGAAAAPAAAVPPGVRTAETTTYEVSKVTRHTLQPRGDIDRLSVAVVLDDDHAAAASGGAQGQRTSRPRSSADIQKIHDLVAASVGLDPDRGDHLTVENIAFEEPPAEDVPAPGKWHQYGPQVMEVGRMAGILVIGVLAIFGVIRPMVRGSLASAPAMRGLPAGAAGAALPRTVQDLEHEIDAQADQASPPRRLPVLTRRVAQLTQHEPENAVRLLRTWLSEDER